jgi:hypothetical protein
MVQKPVSFFCAVNRTEVDAVCFGSEKLYASHFVAAVTATHNKAVPSGTDIFLAFFTSELSADGLAALFILLTLWRIRGDMTAVGNCRRDRHKTLMTHSYI